MINYSRLAVLKDKVMLDLGTFMPIAFIPWHITDSVKEVNDYFLKQVESSRKKNGILCDSSYLTISNIDKGICELNFRYYSVSCNIHSQTKQLWDKKYGWWRKYEIFDNEKLWIDGRLISKNSIEIE